MPSGSLVAGYSKRTLSNGDTLREIIFWERNGLRHGEFTLLSKDDIVDLEFSLDSTLLAIHCISQD
jgi:elongator complex protein 1